MRVVLAMSGGVDSSASAVLLQEQGHEVIGLFMRSGAAEEVVCTTTASTAAARRNSSRDSLGLPIIASSSHKQGCCGASDAADARRVADQLDIPFHALNFQDAFGRIKDYFADEYLSGRTPNPCVMCNNWLKFGKLWDFARQVGAEKIATGHYARIVSDDLRPLPSSSPAMPSTIDSSLTLRPRLKRGLDPAKDQSYVLFGIDPEILDRILLPVGTHVKSEIRDYARRAGLRVAEKKDSQEICFIPDQDYAGFLERYRGIPDNTGDLVDTAGRILGRHDGYHRYTIGQRKRLGIAFGAPRYVVAIEPDTRRVVIGEKSDLDRTILTANRLNWLIANLPEKFRCQAQIRYRHTAAPAEAALVGPDELRVTFDEPQQGITPGQAVVLYEGDTVLGGGWISASQIGSVPLSS